MTTIDAITDLLIGHLRGDLSDAGQEQLNHWLSQSERNRRLFGSIDNEEQLRQLIISYHQEKEEDHEAIILSKIRQGMGEVRRDR